MKQKLQHLIGHPVTVYGVAEGMAVSFSGTLGAPVSFGGAFHVGSGLNMITFHPENVKHVMGLVIELSILEPRTSRLIRKQTKKEL